jgi:hypothetical protein
LEKNKSRKIFWKKTKVEKFFGKITKEDENIFKIFCKRKPPLTGRLL